MDTITRHAQSHGEIFEALTFFNKAMALMKNDQMPEFIKKISKLFEEDIVNHFKTEEREIFSVVLSCGSLPEKRMIRALQREHIDVLEKIDHFKDMVAAFSLKPSEAQTSELASLNKDIIATMLDHSHREDKELFPLLKEIGCRIESNKIRCD